MKIFDYSHFLFINESKIILDDDFYNELMDFRSFADKDNSVRSIIRKIIDIDHNKIDVESKRLNRDKYTVLPSSKNDKVVINKNEMKIGRFISTLLPDLTDKEIENFVNKFKAYRDLENSSSKFELVSGSDIAYWYDCSMYASETGMLGSSCMKSEDYSVFDLYTQNDNVQMLILLNENDMLMGRAIVWKLSNGNYLMDRIYTAEDADVYRFRVYAKERGWYYRAYIQAGNYEISDSDGNIIKPFKPVVELENVMFDRYPYLDTMQYLNVTKKYLTSINGNWGKDDTIFKLNRENGDFEKFRNMKEYIIDQLSDFKEFYKDVGKELTKLDFWKKVCKVFSDNGTEVSWVIDMATDKEAFIDDYMEDRRRDIIEDFNDIYDWDDILRYCVSSEMVMDDIHDIISKIPEDIPFIEKVKRLQKKYNGKNSHNIVEGIVKRDIENSIKAHREQIVWMYPYEYLDPAGILEDIVYDNEEMIERTFRFMSIERFAKNMDGREEYGPFFSIDWYSAGFDYSG